MLYLRVLFCTHVDPEIVFNTQWYKIKQAWSRKMTAEHGKKIVVCGGSSCAHSIMGLRLLQQHGLPTANFGFSIMFGATMLTRAALEELHPGDIFIIAVEPGLLAKPYEMSSFTCKFTSSLDHSEWAYRPWDSSFFPSLGTALRCNTSWKWLMLIPSVYRQAVTDNHYNLIETDICGWQSTTYREVLPPLPLCGSHLSEDHKKLLLWIRQWCESNGVRAVYSLPWSFQEPGKAEYMQSIYCSLLREIAEIIPVFKDPRLGVNTDLGLFSDARYHLTPQGSIIRTDELARQIKTWDIWQPGELEAKENELLEKSARR